MKQIFISLLFIAVVGTLLAQEKYPVPKLTTEQKFNRSINQYWALTAAAINQAKANGMSAYNCGKYMGKLYAPTWGNPDFDGFIKGMVWGSEAMRAQEEKEPSAKENPDGSVTLTIDDKVMNTYFDKKPFGVTYEEFLDYYKGITEVFAADIIKGKTSYKHQDSVLLFTFKKQ